MTVLYGDYDSCRHMSRALGEGRWGQKTMQEVSSIKFSVYRALDLFVCFFSVMILKNTGCYIYIGCGD